MPDGEVRFGFPNINDNAEIAELIACGSHVILFSTGRGSVVGSAISPVIKVCANPETYRRMGDDMDVDAGRILEGRATLPEVGREIYDCAARRQRRADALGDPRPPGIHPHLQILRTHRPGVFPVIASAGGQIPSFNIFCIMSALASSLAISSKSACACRWTP